MREREREREREKWVTVKSDKRMDYKEKSQLWILAKKLWRRMHNRQTEREREREREEKKRYFTSLFKIHIHRVISARLPTLL